MLRKPAGRAPNHKTQITLKMNRRSNKRTFNTALVGDDGPATKKVAKEQIQKIVKKTLFRQAEVKTVFVNNQGTIAAANATPFGTALPMPIPTVGSGSDDRIGDKIRVVEWSINITLTVNATAGSDRLRVAMINWKVPGGGGTPAYDNMYDVLSNAPPVAFLAAENEANATEYSDRQVQLNTAGDLRLAYRRDHKFRYLLTVAFNDGGAGVSTDVDRNLLIVYIAGSQSTNMSTYNVQQRLRFIDV